MSLNWLLVFLALSCKQAGVSPLQEAKKVATTPKVEKPTLQITNVGIASLAGIETLDFAFASNNAKYIEYYLCNDKGLCSPTQSNPKQVPAQMQVVSQTVQNGGVLGLSARACNYAGSTRSSAPVCSDWSTTKQASASSSSPAILALLDTRQTLLQQKSDLCKDLLLSLQSYPSLLPDGEESCRLVMETPLSNLAVAKMQEKSAGPTTAPGLALLDSTNTNSTENKQLNTVGQAFEYIGIVLTVLGGLATIKYFSDYNALTTTGSMKYAAGKFIKYSTGGLVVGILSPIPAAFSFAGAGFGTDPFWWVPGPAWNIGSPPRAALINGKYKGQVGMEEGSAFVEDAETKVKKDFPNLKPQERQQKISELANNPEFKAKTIDSTMASLKLSVVSTFGGAGVLAVGGALQRQYSLTDVSLSDKLASLTQKLANLDAQMATNQQQIESILEKTQH